jgi:hypothetical protein
MKKYKKYFSIIKLESLREFENELLSKGYKRLPFKYKDEILRMESLDGLIKYSIIKDFECSTDCAKLTKYDFNEKQI